MNLRLARMKKGLNQKMLAEIMGLHPALISQYENGRRRPSIKTAKKLAAVLDFNWVDLYEDNDDRSEQEK